MTATRGLAFTTTERVIHRVHRHAAHVRALPEPTAATGFSDRDVLVIDVADLPDGRHTLDVDLSDLARRQLDRRVLTLARDQLHRRPGAARHLAALARLQLHVVDLRAERNGLERHAIAGQDVDAVARHDRVADLDADRLQDVALLAVGVADERNPRRSIRVVLDRLDRADDVLLVALEVDDAVEALVAAAAPPRRHLALVVPSARAVQVLGQRPVRLARRDLVEGQGRLAPEARRGRIVFAYRHGVLRSLQEFGQLLAIPQPHVRLLPVRAPPHVLALALHLAVRERRAHALHFRAEQRLDGALDVDLVGVH